jgi:hypothetical protein
MVKLIRLTTQDPNGYYNNEFHSELIIPANSKIALHSLTAEINTESITIDAQNDNIKFKMQKSEEEFRSIHIENGFYSSSNFNSLFTDITLKMNRLMQYTPNEIGRQWRVGVNTNKKVMFENTFGENIQPSVSANTKLGSLNVATVSTGKKSSRDGGIVGNTDAFFYMKSPQCKGSSSLRAKVFNVNTKNCIIGYTSTPQNTNTTLIDLATIKYGIKLNGDGLNYSYIKDGITTSSTTLKNVNDYFSIDAYASQIFLNIYRDNDGTITLNSYSYDHTTDLFPVIIFLGDSTSILSNIQFSSDPFYNILNTTSDAPELTVSIPTISQNATIRVINFMDADLAKFLGYKQTSYESDNLLNIDFPAFYAFQPADFSDSFVIELLNLNVDSYDGLTKERRNFLHTIVQADIVRNRLTYTAPYLLFLDMKNSQPLSLRQIKARMLKEDLSQVNLTGISQITLIIE